MVKINSSHNKKSNLKRNIKLEFTGERLIPEVNKGSAFFYEHLARYLFAAQFVSRKKVLDIGCGTGYGSHILAKYGDASNILSIDIDTKTLDYARSKYSHPNIEYKLDDACLLNTAASNSIDVVVAFELIEHLSQQRKLLESIKRVLKPDGFLLISTPNKYTYPSGNIFHKKELSPKKFESFLKKYFKETKILHQAFQLSQSIISEKNSDFNFEENFEHSVKDVYSHVLNAKNSQYLIAVCTQNSKLNFKTLSFNLNKVDSFDLNKGLNTLGLQFSDLWAQVNNLTTKLDEKQLLIGKNKKEMKILKSDLNKIQSSKAYKLWQLFCLIKKRILNLKNE